MRSIQPVLQFKRERRKESKRVVIGAEQTECMATFEHVRSCLMYDRGCGHLAHLLTPRFECLGSVLECLGSSFGSALSEAFLLMYTLGDIRDNLSHLSPHHQHGRPGLNSWFLAQFVNPQPLKGIS